jgi:hypothetical protein
MRWRLGRQNATGATANRKQFNGCPLRPEEARDKAAATKASQLQIRGSFGARLYRAPRERICRLRRGYMNCRIVGRATIIGVLK